MLRAASFSVARRAVLNSSRGAPSCAAPRAMAFHASAPREEEEAKTPAPVSKGGLFGTGLSEWFALPIGITAAIPIIKFDWYVINEETQLAAVFIAFCVALYTQGGDAIYRSLDERAQAMLKEHNEAEDKVIEALEQKLEFLQANKDQVDHFETINKMREEAYVNLNAAGAIKPQHDFKAQVERMLNMIAVEEASYTEKKKVALMTEATEDVTAQFTNDKALKKAALDSAIAGLKGGAADGGSDPVRNAFVQFFKNKAAEAAKAADDSEEQAQKAALVAKMNAVAKSEGYFFQFDDSGKPKMVV
eukprot:CAMPEP_0183303762 /NCGR_PEP_ID=MMETSP0160_2-20130417/9080_1 /TAXON_ID=2839 ORGANISM="Odontella Sinensis, Strain Grunow 1884" /NCGR_SAMPLE_ID=MMETSP0160_2 /ASSEMBLY_ACC=CAM_ASM_000250 /LENGTH=303 /DNA_ID=CAMNT_0025466715 /DNA_START=89 /DNA_END=1000 /DNA_ORIENTATION=-